MDIKPSHEWTCAEDAEINSLMMKAAFTNAYWRGVEYAERHGLNRVEMGTEFVRREFGKWVEAEARGAR